MEAHVQNVLIAAIIARLLQFASAWSNIFITREYCLRRVLTSTEKNYVDIILYCILGQRISHQQHSHLLSVLWIITMFLRILMNEWTIFLMKRPFPPRQVGIHCCNVHYNGQRGFHSHSSTYFFCEDSCGITILMDLINIIAWKFSKDMTICIIYGICSWKFHV